MDDLILKRCKYCDKTYEGTTKVKAVVALSLAILNTKNI